MTPRGKVGNCTYGTVTVGKIHLKNHASSLQETGHPPTAQQKADQKLLRVLPVLIKRNEKHMRTLPSKQSKEGRACYSLHDIILLQ
jgi:hypothetical protein